VERYSDPDQIIIATGEDYGFATWSESLGLDVNILQKALWRTEVRLYQGDDALWPDAGGPLQKNGGFVVTSLALSF
jgi:hypothetical protein